MKRRTKPRKRPIEAEAVVKLGGHVVHFFDQILFTTIKKPRAAILAEFEQIGDVIHHTFKVECLIKTVSTLLVSPQSVIMFYHEEQGVAVIWQRELHPGQLTLVGYDQYCAGRSHLLKKVCREIYGDLAENMEMMYGEIDLRDYLTTTDRAALQARGDPLPVEPEGCGRPDCEACNERARARTKH